VLRLVAIGRDGNRNPHVEAVSDIVVDVVAATVQMYAEVGFAPPWIGYLAVVNDVCVGACGFKMAPKHGRAEIAYFTFPDHERRGYATSMARALVDVAGAADPRVIVTAQTLPEKNASTRILEKLGFRLRGPVEHPEDGTVWQWELFGAGAPL